MTKEQKETIKHDAITWLYKSGIMHQKIKGMNIRHFTSLPEADIESDVLQHIFMLLWEHDTDHLVKRYLKDPNSLIGIAVNKAKWQGYSKDSRQKKYWSNSIGQEIVNQSVFRYDNFYLETTTDFGDTLDILNDDEYQDPFTELYKKENVIQPDKSEMLYINPDNKEYWLYIKQNLTMDESSLLDKYLNGEVRLTNICNTDNKQDYRQLIRKIKKITKTYLTRKEHE